MPKDPAPVVADPNVFFACYLAGLGSAGIRGVSAQLNMAKEAWDVFFQLIEWANTKAQADIEAKRAAAAAVQAKKDEVARLDKEAEERKKEENRKRFAEQQAAQAAAV